MAMSHRDCDHESTPKARAKCRSMQAALDRGVANMKLDAEPQLSKREQARLSDLQNRQVKPRTVVNDGPKQSRTRAIKAPHDLVDVPHAFRHVIDWAWENDLAVRTGPTFNDNERTIVIESDHGWLTLIWRTSTPHGIHGSSWRSRGTSVAQKLMTVNDGLERLRG